MVHHPVIYSVFSDSLDKFSKLFEDVFVEHLINCLFWRSKLFVYNSTASKSCFESEAAHLRFHLTRENFVSNFSFCNLLSGSYTKDLSPTIILSKKFGAIDRH